MPTTPALGFRYPPGNIVPNVPLAIQQLAEDAEASLVGVDVLVPASANWVSTLTLRRVGKIVVAGGKIVPAASPPAGTGVLAAAAVTIGVIPGGFRPATQLRLRCFLTQSPNAFEVILNTSGSIEARIVTGTPTTLTSASIWGVDGVAWATS